MTKKGILNSAVKIFIQLQSLVNTNPVLLEREDSMLIEMNIIVTMVHHTTTKPIIGAIMKLLHTQRRKDKTKQKMKLVKTLQCAKHTEMEMVVSK